MTTRLRFLSLSTFVLTLFLYAPAFAQGEKKTAYGILIDNSGSMRTQFPQAQRLSQEVVRRINRHGAITLFTFVSQADEKNDKAVVSTGVAWSEDEKILNDEIAGLKVVPGQTKLFDAVSTIADEIVAKVSLDKEAFGNGTLVLITDGEDRISYLKESQVIRKLKESGVRVFAIGLVQKLESEGSVTHRSPQEKATSFLKKVTKETGGRVIFQKSDAKNIEDFFSELSGATH